MQPHSMGPDGPVMSPNGLFNVEEIKSLQRELWRLRKDEKILTHVLMVRLIGVIGHYVATVATFFAVRALVSSKAAWVVVAIMLILQSFRNCNPAHTPTSGTE